MTSAEGGATLNGRQSLSLEPSGWAEPQPEVEVDGASGWGLAVFYRVVGAGHRFLGLVPPTEPHG